MAGLLDRDPFLGETDGEAIIHDTGVSERQKRKNQNEKKCNKRIRKIP